MFDWVDWESMETAVKKMRKMSCCRWLCMMKIMNDLLHTSIWAERLCGEEAKCGECGEMEKQENMFGRAHEDRQQHQKDVKEAFIGIVRKRDTAGELLMTMMKCMDMWETNPDVAINEEEPIVKFDGKDQVFRGNMTILAEQHTWQHKTKMMQGGAIC